jgi:hypothetical protein
MVGIVFSKAQRFQICKRGGEINGLNGLLKSGNNISF